MMKRVTWFVGGAVAGVAGANMARKKAKVVMVEYAPAQMAKKTSDRVREAFVDGRRAMQAKEAELRARMDGRVSTLADELDDGDAVIVDGLPVEPGQVIVLKQVRDARDQPGRRRRA
ncbi:MAG: hypothetical protein ACOYMR_00040 [Ilumatobacteraceae bacterium]